MLVIDLRNVPYGSTFLLSYMCGDIDNYARAQHSYTVLRESLTEILMIAFQKVPNISTFLLSYMYREIDNYARVQHYYTILRKCLTLM